MPPPATGPNLTAEQAAALAVLEASVALSAGAGCGKTTVLTSRFLAALDHPAPLPLPSTVALTFTEKAAGELRKRIRDACRDRLEAADADSAPHWKNLLRGLEAAPIGTFHEFCGALLRRHAHRAGLDPDFEVLDAVIAPTVRDEAIARTLRARLAAEDPDLIELAVEYGLNRTRDALNNLVALRDGDALAAWAARSPEDLLDAWREAWKTRAAPLKLPPLLEAAEKLHSWIKITEFEHAKLRDLRVTLLEILPRIEANADDPPWLTAARNQAKVPPGLQKKHWPSPEANESGGALLKGFREAVDKWLGLSLWSETDSRRAADLGLKFARLAVETRAAYELAKSDRGGLDFDDLIVKARNLLRVDPEAAQGAAGEPPRFVLVDEFQDTDPVQAEILRHLGGEAFAAGRMFLVGDFKQSIYRFRGAEPRLFQTIRDEFPPPGRLDLTANFRSAAAIIHFVNALFANAFENDPARLLPGPHAARPAGPPAVEFLWAEEPPPPGDSDRPRKPNAAERRQTEARWLARLLKSRLEAGWPVLDRKSRSHALRPAHAGDVAILFRSLNDLAAYESALDAHGLDYYVVGGAAFYNQQEVQDLINLLSVIEDPCDAVALAATLRSPFFAVSDEGLFWLGTALPGDLADNLPRHLEIPDLTPTDRDRLARAHDLLTRWRSLKDRVPTAALVDRVLDESGYEAALLGEFLGDRKRANARKLVRLARKFDGRNGLTLGRFVARLRADQKDPPREEQAATTDEDGKAVRLMSIHQAKGLEFPIVIVPDLNRKPNQPTDLIAFHPDLGPVARPPTTAEGPEDAETDTAGKSLGLQALNALEQAEDDAESLRVLYVATTRARDHLILSSGHAPDAKPASPALKLLEAKFDRATGAPRELPAGLTPPIVGVIATPPPPPQTPRTRRARPRLHAVARLIERAARKAKTDPEPSIATPLKPPRPHSFDLEAARGLTPRSARLDRLLRTILADPRAFDPGAFEPAARRAARRQAPLAHGLLLAEAEAHLGDWCAGSFRNMLADHPRIERAQTWTVRWPDHPNGTAFHGWTDFLLRDEEGDWTIVNFSAPGSPPTLERLRTRLGARAIEALGLGPVVRSWRIVLGEKATLEGDETFNEALLEQAIAAALGPDHPHPEGP